MPRRRPPLLTSFDCYVREIERRYDTYPADVPHYMLVELVRRSRRLLNNLRLYDMKKIRSGPKMR